MKEREEIHPQMTQITQMKEKKRVFVFSSAPSAQSADELFLPFILRTSADG